MELGATPRLAERAVSSLVSRAADPRVVERARDGDRDAFSLLFRQTVDAVGRYVVTILGDSDAAEDVVSETFLDAWRQLPRLRRPDRFEAWLFRIARNRAIDALRGREASPMEDADLNEPDQQVLPEELVLQRERSERLRSAMLTLPADYQQVVLLRLVRGLSHAEIASQTGRSEGASRVLLFRALKKLCEELGSTERGRAPGRAPGSAS